MLQQRNEGSHEKMQKSHNWRRAKRYDRYGPTGVLRPSERLV